jgi:hypothetical protein
LGVADGVGVGVAYAVGVGVADAVGVGVADAVGVDNQNFFLPDFIHLKVLPLITFLAPT